MKKSLVRDNDRSNSDESSGDDSDARGVSEVGFVKAMTLIHFGREEVELRDLVYRL